MTSAGRATKSKNNSRLFDKLNDEACFIERRDLEGEVLYATRKVNQEHLIFAGQLSTNTGVVQLIPLTSLDEQSFALTEPSMGCTMYVQKRRLITNPPTRISHGLHNEGAPQSRHLKNFRNAEDFTFSS